MTLEAFNKMTEDERAAFLQAAEGNEKALKDQEAEIASLKLENENFKAGTSKLESELKETKELNFTLARQIDTSRNRPSFEDTLQEIFYPQPERRS